MKHRDCKLLIFSWNTFIFARIFLQTFQTFHVLNILIAKTRVIHVLQHSTNEFPFKDSLQFFRLHKCFFLLMLRSKNYFFNRTINEAA